MIITEKEYQQALARLEELWGIEQDDPRMDEFNKLVYSVTTYEVENYKIRPPSQEEAIKFRKEQEE